MPLDIVARAVEAYPDKFSGLAGIDPYMGMDGVRALETAVRDMGFIGAHLYPHWFELAPDHAKYYPIYTKCCELDIPIQMQVGTVAHLLQGISLPQRWTAHHSRYRGL